MNLKALASVGKKAYKASQQIRLETGIKLSFKEVCMLAAIETITAEGGVAQPSSIIAIMGGAQVVTSRLLASLRDKGLIDYKQGEEDGRERIVTLSSEGVEAVVTIKHGVK